MRRRLSELARARAHALYPGPAQRIARRLGFDVVRADYYSPIADVTALPDAVFEQPASMPGVDLRLDASVALLRDTLAPFIAEYRPSDTEPSTPHGFYRDNGMYPAVDAEILYAMIRHLQPRRVVELGAGFSTLVISDAIARNDRPAERRMFDPHPSPVVARAGLRIEPRAAESLPPETFADLADGDVLMIDTTHAVRPGGDVTHLLLEIVPRLAPGVVVHIHDFYRPFEYPRWLYTHLGVHWQEHHLVQAFLAHNPAFEVVMANYALARLRPQVLAAVIPGLERYRGYGPGSALWIRRTGAAGSGDEPDGARP